MAFSEIFSDAFSGEGSDVNIENHTPDLLGDSWTRLSSSTSAPRVSSSDATVIRPFSGSGNSDFKQALAVASGGFASDQKTEATGIIPTFEGLIVRGTDVVGGLDGYVTFYNNGDNRWKIEKWEAGVITATLASHFDGAVDPIGTDIIEFEAIGSSISLYKNSILLVSVIDTTFTNGAPGLQIKRTINSSGIDNFKGYEEAAVGGPTGHANFYRRRMMAA